VGFFLVQARGASDHDVDMLERSVPAGRRIYALRPYRESGQIETVQRHLSASVAAPSAFIVRAAAGTGTPKNPGQLVTVPDYLGSLKKSDCADQRHVGPRSPLLAGQRPFDPLALTFVWRGGGLSFAVTGTNLAISTETAARRCRGDCRRMRRF